LTDKIEEIELMKRVGQGDAASYRIVADEHLRSIMNYAYRLLSDRTEAEDVAQETFLRLWTHANDWQPQSRLSAWLHRIAHNLCVDRLRRRREQIADRIEGFRASDQPGSLVARKQLAEVVENALTTLPERQRAAISLVHYQGLSNIEAAQVLDISVDALESLLARPRSTLRKNLGNVKEIDGDDYER
jgi:RNA polymerase sigma-70 factor (ECF subfamily)